MKPGRYHVGIGACLAVGMADLGVLNLWVMPKIFASLPSLEAREPADVRTAAPAEIQAAVVARTPDPPSVLPPPAVAPPAPPARAPTPVDSQVPRLTILFAAEKSEVRFADAANLRALAKELAQQDQRTVVIEGHADALGPEPYNQALSEWRAAGVARRLEQAGVARSRITVRWHGSARPADVGGDRAAFQRNRRVEIFLEDAR